tara:strand:- start:4417 stop:5325 length:909 start_codon:yes stop_codon:yes gene_type:complete
MLIEILDDEYKKQIIFLLNNIWTGRTDRYFPVQTSVNIERCHFTKLNDYDYIFAKKDTINTKRAILFTFINSRSENTSVIIFKDFTVYKVDINCSYEYFYGSIFDISFTEEKIIICDSFMSAGNKINTISYMDRIAEAKYFKNNTLKSSIELDVLYWSQNIIEFSKLNENEELFMISNNLPITTGVNYSCFKWKPVDRITFNLLAEENDKDIDLYTTNFKKLVLFAKIKDDTQEGKEQIEYIKKLENYQNKCIIEFNKTVEKLEIIKVIKDKTIPTTIRMIEKILHLKIENITFDDILSLEK